MEEKKESGIETLIELLNEYEKVREKSEYYEWEKSVRGPFHLFVRDTYDEHHIYSEAADAYAISKEFGFIKWLVENDKINTDLISRVLVRAYVSPKNHVSLECEFHDYYESLLMLLSISDEPIQFLISILK